MMSRSVSAAMRVLVKFSSRDQSGPLSWVIVHSAESALDRVARKSATTGLIVSARIVPRASAS
jgi:hypothetical protein